MKASNPDMTESRDPVSRGGQEEAGGLLPIRHPDPGEGGAEEVLGFLGEHRLTGPDCAVITLLGYFFIKLGWKK